MSGCDNVTRARRRVRWYFYGGERVSSSTDPLILGHLLSEVIQDKQIERRHCPWSLTVGRDKFDRQ